MVKKIRPPEPKEFAQLGDYLGETIALKMVDRKQQITDYGDQTVYVVDVVTPSGEAAEGLYCFWRDIQKQLDQARGEWIAGLLRKERAGRYERYVLDPSSLSEEDLARLDEVISAGDDDIPF